MKTKEELNALKRGNTKMENISKEELKNLLGVDQLSDDDLEKISGGLNSIDLECMQRCANTPGRASLCLENCRRINS